MVGGGDPLATLLDGGIVFGHVPTPAACSGPAGALAHLASRRAAEPGLSASGKSGNAGGMSQIRTERPDRAEPSRAEQGRTQKPRAPPAPMAIGTATCACQPQGRLAAPPEKKGESARRYDLLAPG